MSDMKIGDRMDSLSKSVFRIDHDFDRMMCDVENNSEEVLVKKILSAVMAFAEATPSNFRKLIDVYSDYSHLWGGFDPETGNYAHFLNGVQAVKEHTEDIRWLYNNVEDYRSRKVIYGLVKFWLELDFSYKNSVVENNYDDYFDLDILRDKMTSEEVFVDCGAYTGDTAKAYYENFGKCRKMYLYDMLPANINKAKDELEGHPEIIYRNVGVGSPEQAGMMIPVSINETSTFSLNEQGQVFDPEARETGLAAQEVEMVTLDDDIKERITFLKMDIEGSEINAIMGAKEHIVNDHPKLAICTYHHYEHLWEIPKLIKSLNTDYKIYLRYNGALNGAMASEHVVLAV